MVLAASCGGPPQRVAPTVSVGSVPREPVSAPAHPGSPGALVGFVCPAGAAGRPVFFPVAQRGDTAWLSTMASLVWSGALEIPE